MQGKLSELLSERKTCEELVSVAGATVDSESMLPKTALFRASDDENSGRDRMSGASQVVPLSSANAVSD